MDQDLFLAMGCKMWDLATEEFNTKEPLCFYQLSLKNITRAVKFSTELACLPTAAWQVQQQSYTSYSTPLLSRTFFHVFMKRTLLIIGQVTPGSTQPWHDNPIRWEDPGRRYGRNGVEISLPWSETHFLMHNKAFILLAVTRKVFVREGECWS